MMKAILFDLFGTLVHSRRISNAYGQLFASVPATPAHCKQVALTRALDFHELARELGSTLPAGILDELAQALAAEVASVQPYPEALEALREARQAGAKVAVSSNLAKPYGAVAHLLEGLVDHWCFSFETGYAKPDARMFLEPAARLRAQVHECTMIGDSFDSDIVGAASAGMASVMVCRSGAKAALWPQSSDVLQAVRTALGR